MHVNTADQVFKGDAGFTKGIAMFNRRVGQGNRDEQLMDLWSTEHINDEDTFVLHMPNDPWRRLWSARVGTLELTRYIDDQPNAADLVFYAEGINEGILVYLNGCGDDFVLTTLQLSMSFKEGDVFTIHYDSTRSGGTTWSLKTAEYSFFKTPQASAA